MRARQFTDQLMNSKILTEVRRVEVRLLIESAMAEDLAWEA